MRKKIKPLKDKLLKTALNKIQSKQSKQDINDSIKGADSANPFYDKRQSSVVDTITNNRVLSGFYRRLSGQALDVAVKPHLVGTLPEFAEVNQHNQANQSTSQSSNQSDNQVDNQADNIEKAINTQSADVITFYVLKEYSRSNSILIDLQTKEHQLPPALSKVTSKNGQIDERAGIVFLHHPKADKSNKKRAKNKRSNHAQGNVSPRLQRLICAVQRNPELKVRLVPVTILWGRAPEKEDSLFKLLVADNWQEPSLSKQLFNIGVMGRDTFVEFHQPLDLSNLMQEVTYKTQVAETDTTNAQPSTALITAFDATHVIAQGIQLQLLAYLDKYRASILGPDLSDKRNVIDKLLYSPTIKKAIEDESLATGKSKHELRAEARGYLNEIVSDYSYPIVRLFDNFLTWLWTQLYDGVEIANFDRVRGLATDNQIIYVPCHRSHIDYLLLSFIIYKQGLSIPNIAAGNNLNMPVVGQLLRNGGAFFMRRTFKGNPLYATVFKEYLHSMIYRSTPIEYFIEGGRSRTGRLLPPKLGMLSMTVQSHLRRTGKPIVFIPTYIGYERIMEGGTYIGELKGKPKESESLLGLFKARKQLERIFGTVHVNFGTPLHLTDFMHKFDVQANSLPADTFNVELTDDTQSMIANLGIKIMQNINRAAVVTPVSLLSLVMLSTPKSAIDEISCREQIALYQRLANNLLYDDDTKVTDMSPQAIIDYGIKLKLVERQSHILGDMIQVANNQAPLLSYFRNNILHVYILSSFLSALIERNGKISRELIHSIAKQMYPFLQTELFLKYPQRDISAVLTAKLDNLIREGLVVDLGKQDGQDYVGIPDSRSREHQQLQVLAIPVDQSLERYIMTLTLLAEQGSGKLTAEQAVDLCQLLGQRVSVLYADDIPDAFDKTLFAGFINALIRLGYLHKDSETGVLIFDQAGNTIRSIADNARYILNPEIMQILHNVADLGNEEIARVTEEINAKKARRLRRKK